MSEATSSEPKPQPRRGGGRGALLVASGILASRLFGLVREAVFARYFGNADVSAAFKAALRVPNFLQNLLGEGVLSASFIPVYSQLLGAKKEEDADKVAGAVFGLLSLATALLVLGGVLLTPAFIDLVAPGFEGETRALTIRLVRILFPMTGLLVLSAWCLGVLNSHRRFFLSYAAPVIWNGAMIAAMLGFGWSQSPEQLAVTVAWAAVVGAGLQFGVQLPAVLRLLGRLRPSVGKGDPNVGQVVRSFGPVVVARGVVQISAYIDLIIGSLISTVAFSTLDYAQRIYLIPVALFGMSISAAELPEMSRATGEEGDPRGKIRERLERGLSRVAFFVVPSVAAFLTLGDVIAAAILQRGLFTAADSRLVWYVLMASGLGLLATTQSRLFSSTFYALKDTRTPLYTATLRVVIAASLAYFAGVHLPPLLGLPAELGAVGIPAATGIAAWVEFLLLRRRLKESIGVEPAGAGRLALFWACAGASGLLVIALKLALVRTFGADPLAVSVWGGTLLPAPQLNHYLTALLLVVPFGLTYFGLTYALGVPESQAVIGRMLRRRRS